MYFSLRLFDFFSLFLKKFPYKKRYVKGNNDPIPDRSYWPRETDDASRYTIKLMSLDAPMAG